ncbi:MAG: DUF2029 domain-containing protein [Deltaproteobacteria bacterium]|nr:MAG: DUF2029 domain-containing protein [Deltaproteobacteria bacterium]
MDTTSDIDAASPQPPGSPSPTPPGPDPSAAGSRARRAGRVAELVLVWGAVAFAAFVVAKYLYVALNTVDFPYQLEWMEGGFVETVQRLAQGQDIYPPPGLEYTGYIYPPFYYLVSAAFGGVMGVDFFALRLVSFLSILGVGALIYRFVQRETDTHRWAVIAVGLFFATYEVGGRWFHIARVDSLLLLLLLASLYVLRFRTTLRSAVAAGVLMACAVMTKQTAAIALLPAGLVLLFTDRRRALVAGAVGAGLAGLTVLVLNAVSDGWFWYYLVEVPRAHLMLDDRITSFWTKDMWHAGIALGAAIAGGGLLLARRPKRGLFYVAVAVGLLVSAWLARIHDGGWTNVVIPGFAAVALLGPLGLGLAEGEARASERRRLGASPTAAALALMIAAQLGMLGYRASWSIPPDDAQDRGDQFLGYLASLPGDVLLPDWRFLPQWADKRSYGLGMAAQDVRRMRDPDDPGKKRLNAELTAAFRERRFSHVILTDRHHPLLPLMRPYYRYGWSIDLIAPMVAGATVLPRIVYVPNDR